MEHSLASTAFRLKQEIFAKLFPRSVVGQPVIMDPWESERVCELPYRGRGGFDPKELGTILVPIRMIRPQKAPLGGKTKDRSS